MGGIISKMSTATFIMGTLGFMTTAGDLEHHRLGFSIYDVVSKTICSSPLTSKVAQYFSQVIGIIKLKM